MRPTISIAAFVASSFRLRRAHAPRRSERRAARSGRGAAPVGRKTAARLPVAARLQAALRRGLPAGSSSGTGSSSGASSSGSGGSSRGARWRAAPRPARPRPKTAARAMTGMATSATCVAKGKCTGLVTACSGSSDCSEGEFAARPSGAAPRVGRSAGWPGLAGRPALSGVAGRYGGWHCGRHGRDLGRVREVVRHDRLSALHLG